MDRKETDWKGLFQRDRLEKNFIVRHMIGMTGLERIRLERINWKGLNWRRFGRVGLN